MPCTVTAFGVNIVPPGDGAIESAIAREVIADWNGRNALGQKRLLLPLDAPVPDASSCDLLVAFFRDSSELSSDLSASCDDTQIENHLGAAKPALFYFSDARIDLGHEPLPGRALQLFKKRHAAAIVDSYGDEKEFRAKFTRDLEAMLETNAALKVEPAAPASTAGKPCPAAPLSEAARTILSEACDDFEAYIGRTKLGGTLKIQANGKQLVDPGDPASVAKWESAFDEILSGGYIRDVGCNGQLFQISTKGFEFLKTIGKTPIGYIAELGGM